MTPPRRSPARATTALVVLTLCALLAAACGTRLSDEERALYTSADDGNGESASGTSGSEATSESSDSGSVGSGDATASGADAVSGGGTGGGDIGEAAGDGATGNDGTEVVAAAGSACAGSASGAPGVTDDTITLGSVMQLSGAVPGFAQQSVNGAQAYVAFVNATGGLCGRELKLEIGDDGFDASRNASEYRRIESKVLAFVAGYSVTDSGAATTLGGTNVADIGVAASTERANYANNFSHLPQVGGTKFPEFAYVKSQGVSKAIIVHVAAAAARQYAEQAQAGLEKTGIDVQMLEISNTQFSYKGPVGVVKESGAQLMILVHELSGSVQMVNEMRTQGVKPQFEWYRVAYGQEFLRRAGDDANGVVAFLESAPFEEAGSIPEMAVFQEWLKRVAPNAEPTFESINAWINLKLAVQAIRGIDGDISRDAMLASIKSITSFDADGLINTMNPAAKSSGACKVIMRVEGGKWTREAPANGFFCG